MSDDDELTACSSGYDHRHNHVSHYLGCLKLRERSGYYDRRQEKNKKRIREEESRIARLRSSFEADQQSEAGQLLVRFKMSLQLWRNTHKKGGRAGTILESNPPTRESESATGQRVPEPPEKEMKASMVFFMNSRPYTHPDWGDKFPNQKVSLYDLLYKTDKSNPLMRDCEEGMIRYFHLPANNMHWVEVIPNRLSYYLFSV